MLRTYKNVESGGSRLFVVSLRLALVFALALILVGCGEGGTADSSGQGNADSGDGAAGETKTGQVEQATGGDGELNAPTLGEADAPVVMVEYSDYQ